MLETCVTGQGQGLSCEYRGPTTADPRLCAVQQTNLNQRAGTTVRPEDLVINRVGGGQPSGSLMAVCRSNRVPPATTRRPTILMLELLRSVRLSVQAASLHNHYSTAGSNTEQGEEPLFNSPVTDLELMRNSPPHPMIETFSTRVFSSSASPRLAIHIRIPTAWDPLPSLAPSTSDHLRCLIITATSPRSRPGRPFINI